MACAVSEVHLKPGRLSCLSLKNIPLIAEGRHDVKCVQTLMGPEKSCTCPIKESKVRQKLQLSLGQSEQRGLGLPFLNEDSVSISHWGKGMDYHDIELFALETNRDQSFIFEIASKYCM